MQLSHISKYTYAALVITLAATIYWVLFQVNSVATFHIVDNEGFIPYAMYYYAHYPVPNLFQYLIFCQHIAPDQWLLFPFFSLSPSMLTLNVLNAIIVCLTGLLLFFISKDLLGKPFF